MVPFFHFALSKKKIDAAMVHNLQSLGWRRLSFALNTFTRSLLPVFSAFTHPPTYPPTSHDAIIQKETVPLLTPAHIGRGAVNSVGSRREKGWGEEGGRIPRNTFCNNTQPPTHLPLPTCPFTANILQRDHERASKQQPIHSPTPFPPPLSSLSIFSPLKEAKL